MTTPNESNRRWTPVFLPAPALAPAGAYSPAVRAGDLVFVSGQVPRDPTTGEMVDGDVATQTVKVLDNLRLALEAAGATLADVVAITAYLQNAGDWGTFNEVYRRTFSAPYPTRTTVGADLRNVLVEISAIAYVGGRGARS
jgi:2-iminobutanoate/2-iminopropanoate deaminase